MKLIFLFLVLLSQARVRCSQNGFCKDVTLGDCTFEEDDIIDIITSPDAATCQAICEIFAGCTFFHFDRLKGDENCVLLTESYRQLCHSIGSPVNQNVEDCIISLEDTCDMIMEEDCEYMGELVYISPPGSIRTKDKCEDLCMDFEFLNCNYWSFVKSSSTCYLYTSQDRNCQAIGGPQKPNITECMSMISTTSPATASTIVPENLLGCSAVTATKCYSDPDIKIKTLGGVQDTETCQFYCNTVYGDVCQYFVHDLIYEDCILLSTDQLDFCYETSGSPLTDITHCKTAFNDKNEEISCLNFREHVCKYKGNVIFSLLDTEDIGSCQDSCTSYMPECKFFNYDSDRKICELLDSGERECEMVRGTPTPDFEKCKLDGHIHWP